MWTDSLTLLFENIYKFPCKTTVDKVMSMVSASEFLTRAIFDVQCSTLYKFHHEAMYLQLIAAGPIGIET